MDLGESLQNASSYKNVGGNTDDIIFGLQLPQTTLHVPYSSGVVGGGLFGGGLALTLFTLFHAMMSQFFEERKQRRVRSLGRDPRRTTGLLDQSVSPIENLTSSPAPLDEWNTHAESARTGSYPIDKSGRTERQKNIIQNLKTIFPSLNKRQEKHILRKLSLLPEDSYLKDDLEKRLLKKHQLKAGKDLQSHVDSVFSSYSKNDCQMVNKFCKLAVEARSNLTPDQEKSLRAFRIGFLDHKLLKKMFLHRMLSVATALLYANEEGCRKIARRCFRLCSRRKTNGVSLQ